MEIDIRSCDACPNGCCDMDCSYCYGLLDRDAPLTFARNAWMAAALCRAFEQGREHEAWLANDYEGYWDIKTEPSWWPGHALDRSKP